MRRNFSDEPECKSAFDALARCLGRLEKRRWTCDGKVVRILKLIQPAIKIRKLAAEALLRFTKGPVDAHGAQADLTNELVTLVVEEFSPDSGPDIANRLLVVVQCLDQLSRRPKVNVATNLLKTIIRHTKWEIRDKAADIGHTRLVRLYNEGKGDEGLKAAIYILRDYHRGAIRFPPGRP